jgi:ligand-binding sensor domain-containing protein
MKKIYFILILIVCLSFTKISYSQWQQTNGPHGAEIKCLLTKGGNTFVGTPEDGIYLSTNNGGNWVPVNSGLPDLWISALATDGINIYAGSLNGISISNDNGTSWNFLNNLGFNSVLSLVAFSGNIMAGTNAGGIYLSSDNGNTWNSMNSGLTDLGVYSLAISGSNIFAGTSSGMFVSGNLGASWTPINTGLPNQPIVKSIAINGNDIFIGTWRGIFLSSNNGGLWNSVNVGLTDYYVNSILLVGSNIFAGTYHDGIFLSTNNGGSWNVINNGLTIFSVSSLAFNGTNIFAGTKAGTFSTNNNGSSWVSINNGLNALDITSIVMSGADILAGSYRTIHSSSDFGLTWNAVDNGLTSPTIISLASDGPNIFAGGYYGVFLSTNNGNTWNEVSNGISMQTVQTITIDGSNIFAGTYNGGVFLSNNNGSSWSAVNTGLTTLDIKSIGINGTNIFAGTNGGGVFLSTNLGTSWVSINNGLSNFNITSLAISGANIFACTYGGGVFLSTNNGTTWNAINTGLPNLLINAISIVGTNIFVVSEGQGVYLSTNNGTSWTSFNSGLGTTEIRCLTSDGSNLFAGTNRSGVWKTPISISCIPISYNSNSGNQNVVAPAAAQFAVNVTGSSPSYQWQVSSNGGSGWSNLTNNGNTTWTNGGSLSILNISNTSIGQNNYQYKCIVSNSCPSSAISLPQILSVSAGCINVAIVSDPINQNISLPNSATFSVSVSGTSPTYVWQSLPPGGSWSNLTNGGSNTWTTTGSTSTLTISNSAARDNYQYRCIVSNNCPSSVPSNSATLTLIIPTINSLICTNALPNPPVPQPQNYTFYSDNTPYSNNQPMKVCADGSSATYFKVNVSNTSLVSFKILDEFGVEATDVEKYGELGSVNVFGNDVEVNYNHPQIMGAATGMFQSCSLQILFNGNAVTGVNFPISIYRAPIVFIHGFFGDENTFESLSNDLLSDVLYPMFPNSPLINIVNYHSTSLDHFYTNKRIVQGGIDEEFRKARNGNFSAGKVILIGHSMGGVLSRLYLQSTYANCFYRNDIQKLITVNTPHYGTQFANWGINNMPLLLDIIDIYYGPNVGTDGAIVDLCVDSYSTKYELNIPVGLQNKVPSATISSDQIFDFDTRALPIRLIFNPSLYNDVNDLIVPLKSQQGGILTGTTVPQQWHVGSCKNQNIKTQIRNLIDSSPYSNAFSQAGFPNFTIPVPAFSKTKDLPFARVNSVDTIKINSPNSGQLFNPNDIVPVNIFSSGNLSRMALIIYGNSISPITIDTLNVSQLNFQIPDTAIGELTLLLLGGDTINWSVQDTVHIMVSSTSLADSIVSSPDTSTLALGLFKQIQIDGYFNGSSTGINLFGLTDLIITYDSTLLFYDGYGNFQGLDTGNAVVVFNYQAHSDTSIIQIYNDPSALTAGFNYSNSEACLNNTIFFTDRSQGLTTAFEWQFPGGIPSSSNLRNPSVSYSTEGVYSVSLKTYFVNGADSITMDSLINIHGLPEVEITGDSVICFGDSISLSASSGYLDYLWSTNSTDTNIIVSTSGTYSVFVTDTNSCSNSANKDVQVISIDTSVTQNGVLLNANSTGNYQWIYCDSIPISGETNQTFLPTQDGSYAVIISNNGCVDTSGCYVEIIDEVGFLSSDKFLLIYPNPSFGYVTITINQNILDGNCQIFDATGRMVYEIEVKNTSKNSTLFELNLNPGFYILILNDANTSLKQKFIVK